MPCSPELKACVDDLVAKGYPEDSAWPICRSRLGESVNRSRDFQRIHDEFVNYYKERVKGESEYNSWVRALHLDESKPYSLCQESFRWAKDMLKPLREDEDNKYYQITVGFPLRSMNGNIYKERDLIAAALSLKGKHVSLNHKGEFWFSPNNPANKWGNLPVIDGKYEDGAAEAILQVPKDAVCPICNGARMTDLIDSQKIVNVSLEGECKGGVCVTGECEGFEFGDPPFTLLTSDVLPGIPLARIKPLEQIMSEALQVQKSTGEKKKMKVKAIVKEDAQQNIGAVPKPNVNTISAQDPNLRGTWGTPVTADSLVDSQNDNAKTAVGTPAFADNTNLKTSAPNANVAHHTESKVGEPCSPELQACVDALIADGKPEDSAWAICRSKIGEMKEEDTSQPKPEDIRSGATKSKPGTFNMPNAGSLPSPVTATTVTGSSPVAPRTVAVGTSPVEALKAFEERKARIKAELKVATAEEKAQKFEGMHDDLYKQLLKYDTEHKQTLAVLEDRKATIEKLEAKRDEANRDMHNAQIERDEWHSKYEHQLGIVEDLKTQIEKVRQEQSRATEKYSQTLKTNLELSQKLTKANEDYLEVAKAKEDIEEKLTVARTNAKKTLKLKI